MRILPLKMMPTHAVPPQMCHACDAPDVLAEALQRTNELGLALSINRVHEALMAWGAMLELHKIEQVGGAEGAPGVEAGTGVQQVGQAGRAAQGFVRLTERLFTQVVAAMESGGVPPTTKTAYIMVRAAINSGRVEEAERYAALMQGLGVRLNPTTLRLMELGRESQGAVLREQGGQQFQ